MKNSYLVITDFDGTIADTFSPSPKGVDVNQAYRHATELVLGANGLRAYEEIGGLKNMAPGELVKAILQHGPKKEMIEHAGSFFHKEQGLLDGLVPEGKGTPLTWQDDSFWDPTGVIAEMLVRSKMVLYLPEIGPAWPRPCKGFLVFYDVLCKLKNLVDIQLAILSSGHEIFIKKTFEAWGMPAPLILLTDDHMRSREYPPEPMARVKPSVALFNLVHLMWSYETNGPMADNLQLINFIMESRKRMMYFGDDCDKDGQLAAAAGVPFGWFNPKSLHALGRLHDQEHFIFTDWQDLALHFTLEKTLEKLREGKPLSDILSPLP